MDPSIILKILPILAGTQSLELLAELGQVGNAKSEDCLTLNIWTKPQTGDNAKGIPQ
jgi:cholinesterase